MFGRSFLMYMAAIMVGQNSRMSVKTAVRKAKEIQEELGRLDLEESQRIKGARESLEKCREKDKVLLRLEEELKGLVAVREELNRELWKKPAPDAFMKAKLEGEISGLTKELEGLRESMTKRKELLRVRVSKRFGVRGDDL